MDDAKKQRNQEIMAKNTAIVMNSFIEYDENGNEIERVAEQGTDGFLFLLASTVSIRNGEPLDLEAEMLKRGWLWVGVNEGASH